MGFGDFFSNLASIFGQGAGHGQSQGGGQGGGQGPLGLFQNPGQGLAGLGILGLGQAFAPKVKAPDFGGLQSVQNLSNWNNSASHPLDPNVSQSIQNSLNIQNEQQLRNLRDVYKNARPGSDYTTDSAYQRDLANLNRQISMNGSDALAGAQLQSNAQNLGNMQNLANLDVGKVLAQFGVDSQRANNFNQGVGNIGSLFLEKGLGQPDLSQLFGLNKTNQVSNGVR